MNPTPSAIHEAVEQIKNGIKYKKCWRCGCQQQAIRVIEENLSALTPEDRDSLKPLLEKAKATFVPVEYDCLGCKICFPAIATNELAKAYPGISLEASCGPKEAAAPEARQGWPPLPGDYEIQRYQAAVAICTLNSKELIRNVAARNHPGVGIVGSLSTENLGIERLIKNVVTNPNIRFLILCGEDSKQRIGHLPGQSLASLFEHGVDKDGRIIGAQGKRPVLKNVDARHVEQFRKQVELVAMVASVDVRNILQAADACEGKNLGKFDGGELAIAVSTTQARPPDRLVLDSSGYFVIFLDRSRRCIVVEHYGNNGVLSRVIEGRGIGDIYATAISLGLLSRLDHAAYFGKELAKAEAALARGEPYVQDKAPGATEGEIS